MSQWKHRLRKLNIEESTAICDFCGPVDVRNKKGIWRCRKALREIKRRTHCYKYEHCSGERPNGPCEICGKIVDLVWDHNHDTGLFRGWLCQKCNAGLGMFDEDIGSLTKAIEYINNKPSRN